jgi:hypothetical protein
MKSSTLLGPFGDSEFWGFSLLKIKIGSHWTYWLQILSELCFQRVALSGKY